MTVTNKLQIKPGQRLAVLGRPSGVDLPLEPVVVEDDPANAHAVLLFVTRAADLSTEEAETLVAAARRDTLAWVAYPKGGALGTDLSRDSVAELLSKRAVRPVRQVAIDDTWSALRFRPA